MLVSTNHYSVLHLQRYAEFQKYTAEYNYNIKQTNSPTPICLNAAENELLGFNADHIVTAYRNSSGFSFEPGNVQDENIH